MQRAKSLEEKTRKPLGNKLKRISTLKNSLLFRNRRNVSKEKPSFIKSFFKRDTSKNTESKDNDEESEKLNQNVVEKDVKISLPIVQFDDTGDIPIENKFLNESLY